MLTWTRLAISTLLTLSVSTALAQDDVKDKPRPAFRLAKIKRGNVTEVVKATGTLTPDEVIDIGAQVTGRIVKFGMDPETKKPIDFGSKVEAGMVLAEIDPAFYKAAVEAAAADTRVAQANLQLSEAEFDVANKDRERFQKLLDAKAVSREEYATALAKCEVAKQRVEVAKASFERAKVTLKSAEINLVYTDVRSPIAGEVIDRRVNVGQVVTPSLSAPSLFLLAKDLGKMQVLASVFEADVLRVKKGQEARFTVDALPEESFAGKVSQVRLNAAMTQNVVSFTVAIDVDNQKRKLLPYLTADVEFVVGEAKNVLLVPVAALRWRPSAKQVAPTFRDGYEKMLDEIRTGKKTDTGRGLVWVEEGGHVKPVKVKLGLSDGIATEVVDGELREGTAIVVGMATNAGKKLDGKSGSGLRLDPDRLLVQPGLGNLGLEVRKTLTAADAEAIRRQCPAVVAAAPVVRHRTTLRTEGRNWVPLSVHGTTPAYLEAGGLYEIADGRLFSDDEVRARRKVCVVGQTLADELFASKSPVGKDLRIGDVKFQVIGLLSKAGPSAIGSDQDDIALAPWTAIKDCIASADSAAKDADPAHQQSRWDSMDAIDVRAATGERDEAKEQITRVLRERHRIRGGALEDFTLREWWQ